MIYNIFYIHSKIKGQCITHNNIKSQRITCSKLGGYSVTSRSSAQWTTHLNLGVQVFSYKCHHLPV